MTEGYSECVLQNRVISVTMKGTGSGAGRNAFEELWQRLTNSPVLRLLNPEVPVEEHTDACWYGVGAVTVQKNGMEGY